MKPNFNPGPQVTTSDNRQATPSLGKTFSIVAILTVLSKVIGLVRDIVVAHAYGTGIVADAYNYAYLFTGNILILFGGLGGPFHSSTVAILTPRKDDQNAGKIIMQVLIFTFLGLAAVSVLAFLVAPPVISAMAASYRGQIAFDSLPEALRLKSMAEASLAGGAFGTHFAVPSAQLHFADLPAGLKTGVLNYLADMYQGQLLKQFWIMLPLIIISGLVGISYGVLNVYNRIFWPSLSPAIASLAIIVVVMAADPQTAVFSGIPLAVGTLIGALGQLLAQIPDTLKTKLKWEFSLKSEEGCHEYREMIWPAVFSTSVGQLIVYVDMFFTLNGPIGQGGWTAILMSNRLVQLPLGVLLTAMLVPILPRFTEQVNAGALADLKEEMRRSLRILWFLSLPLTVFFLVIPAPIIRLLFQHGEFTTESTGLVTLALLLLAPSIFFYVARDLVTRVFYAFKDSKTPFHVALIAIVVKAVLDYFLVYHTKLGVGAISLASTVITLVNLSLLTYFLKKKVGLLGFSLLVKPLAIMFTAAACCGGTTWWIMQLFGDSGHLNRLQLFCSIGLAACAGGLVYLAVCLACKLQEPIMVAARVPVLKRFIGKPS
jgi:putative peptidoglycan lipid II flippase